ncbi:hypothetical protein OCU04_000482 [Sclerotinia nivalis]|uniref:Uncharacterized protein n=1 Tax=Sclerotinia nivalis TaxID=352851 RepID=A0A9X0AW60_9HELO|nr:hypothetical protein OCU04_000482 [Sclerotinia nivalis]
MGWFDGASESGRSHSSRHHSSSHSHSKKKHRSSSHSTHNNNSSGLLGSALGVSSPKSSHSHRERSRSRTRGSGSIFGSGDAKHNSSRSSFFGMYLYVFLKNLFAILEIFLPFNSLILITQLTDKLTVGPHLGSNSRSTSHYKRSPRPNYLKSIYAKLRQLLRDLIYYMKRHPFKVFMLVIMPLITGGALAGLLKKFGVRLPGGLEKMIGGGKGRRGAGSASFGNGGNGSYEYERSSVKGSGGAMAKLGMLTGGMDGVGEAMKLAKLFI